MTNLYKTYSTTKPKTYTWNTIGLDDLLDKLDNSKPNNYPPYNIAKIDDLNWVVEVAVAGFKKSEVSVEVAEDVLTVTAKTEENVLETDESVAVKTTRREYLHRGIAKRAFVRRWALAQDVIVKDASLENGLLVIKLERIIPEEKKPRTIVIK